MYVTALIIVTTLVNDSPPKSVTYEQLLKLAEETVKDKKYPARPSYKVSDGMLLYTFPPDYVLTGKDEVAVKARLVAAMMQVEKFRQFPPKEIDKRLVKRVQDKAGKTIKETYRLLTTKKMNKEETDTELDKMKDSVYETIDAGIRDYASAMKLKPSLVAEAVSKAVETQPKGGKVHCITLFEMRLLELQGKDPAKEVMDYVVGDMIFVEGWVYYVVTWDNGKMKSGPQKMFIGGGSKVTFK